MKLYVANCCDRHSDPEIRVFSTSEKACAYARNFVKENASYPDDIEEKIGSHHLLLIHYSGEGDDYATVDEVELDDCD